VQRWSAGALLIARTNLKQRSPKRPMSAMMLNVELCRCGPSPPQAEIGTTADEPDVASLLAASGRRPVRRRRLCLRKVSDKLLFSMNKSRRCAGEWPAGPVNPEMKMIRPRVDRTLPTQI
jgi:hypothetical protein